MNSAALVANRVQQAVDVGASEAALPGAVHDLDAPRVILRELIGDGAGAVGRSIVHDEQPRAFMGEDARGQQGQVLAFVIRRRDDQ